MMSPASKAWRCVVCGYVHHGDEPPELCPVCGAPASDFEQHEETPPPPAAPPTSWRCVVCGYVHEGAEPPDECPLCGARRDSFEPAVSDATPAATGEAPRRIVVIGGGVAGISAAESARKTSADVEITVVAGEAGLPYYRINLTRLLAGEIEESALTLHPASWYEERKIRVVAGAEAGRIDLEKREVFLSNGTAFGFDKLVLASGAHAFVPPFPGSNLDGVFTLRTLDDARAVIARLKPGARCVCIGGGILGLETAGALARHGVEVTLLEGHTYLMPRQLSQPAAEIMAAFVAGIGVILRTQARTKELRGEGSVEGVLLEDGEVLPADVVVIATGVRPNSFLARQAGLDVKTGVMVDHLLCSSHPDVYAAGDAAEHNGILYGSWAAAQYQGHIAGMNAAGASVEFGGIPRSHTLKVLGLDLVSVGRFEPEDASYRVIEKGSAEEYCRFVFRDGRLVGCVLLGDTTLATPVTKAIENRADFSALLSESPDAAVITTHLRDGAK